MVESFFGSGGSGGHGNGNGGDRRPWSFNTILDMKDISPKTQAHLTRVYTTLLAGVGSCAVGMYINSTILLTGFLFMILFMVLMAYLVF